MKKQSTKGKAEDSTALLDEYSNRHIWSKTSRAVHQRIVQSGLLTGTLPEYELMDDCLAVDSDIYLPKIYLRMTTSSELTATLKMLRSNFIHNSRSFELKKDMFFSSELQLLASEVMIARRSQKIFRGGQIRQQSKEAESFLGVLKGKTFSGGIHLRPLLSEEDLRVALLELIEPTVFASAAILQPQPDEGMFVREEGLTFRFVYNYRRPPHWNIMKLKQEFLNRSASSDRKDDAVAFETMRLCLCPALTPFAFESILIDAADVEKQLRKSSFYLLKLLQDHRRSSHMVAELEVDFERIYGEEDQLNEDKIKYVPKYRVLHFKKVVYLSSLANNRRFSVYSIKNMSKIRDLYEVLMKSRIDLSDTDSGSDSDLYTPPSVSQVEGGKRRSVTTASLVDAQPLVNKFKSQVAMKKKGCFQRLSKNLSTDSVGRHLEYIDLNKFVLICMKEKIHLFPEELTKLFSFFDPMMTGLVKLDRMLQELHVDDHVQSEGGDIDAFRCRISQKMIAAGVETEVTIVSPNVADEKINCSSEEFGKKADETIDSDQKFKELKAYLNSSCALKSYERDIVKGRNLTPRITFADYLDDWKQQEIPEDRIIVPESLGVNWLSKYYLDVLYDFASDLSLSEVLTNTEGWLPSATELSKTFHSVETIGDTVAKRGNIFTEQDASDLLESLIQIFDEETAILIRYRILLAYRKRNNIKVVRKHSTHLRRDFVKMKKADVKIDRGKRALQSRAFISKEIDVENNAIGARVPRKTRASIFILSEREKGEEYSIDGWVNRLYCVPDGEGATSEMSPALLKLDPSVEQPVRHYEKTWIRRDCKKRELRMSLIRLNDKNWLEKYQDDLDAISEESKPTSPLGDSFYDIEMKSEYAEEPIELQITGGLMWGDGKPPTRIKTIMKRVMKPVNLEKYVARIFWKNVQESVVQLLLLKASIQLKREDLVGSLALEGPQTPETVLDPISDDITLSEVETVLTDDHFFKRPQIIAVSLVDGSSSFMTPLPQEDAIEILSSKTMKGHEIRRNNGTRASSASGEYDPDYQSINEIYHMNQILESRTEALTTESAQDVDNKLSKLVTNGRRMSLFPPIKDSKDRGNKDFQRSGRSTSPTECSTTFLQATTDSPSLAKLEETARTSKESHRRSILYDMGPTYYSPQPPTVGKVRQSIIRHQNIVDIVLAPESNSDMPSTNSRLDSSKSSSPVPNEAKSKTFSSYSKISNNSFGSDNLTYLKQFASMHNFSVSI